MAELRNFTQPDNSPTFFIQFLEFPDKHEDIKKVRAAAEIRMNLAVETFSVSTAYEFFLRAIAAALLTAAENGVVPRSEIDEFLSEQASLNASRDFFQMWLMTLVTGTV